MSVESPGPLSTVAGVAAVSVPVFPVEPCHQFSVDLSGRFELVDSSGEFAADVGQVLLEGLDAGPEGVVGDTFPPAGHLGADFLGDGFAESPSQRGDLVSQATVLGFDVLEVGPQGGAGDPGAGGDCRGEAVGDLSCAALDLGAQLRVVVHEAPADRRPGAAPKG